MEEAVEGKQYNFSKEEEAVLEFWDSIDAFKEQLRLTEGKPEYVFYDGPPFATGLPHYGHILAGTLKDVVTRYASMTGHHVSRRFGWDCHGLPVEYEIDKKLGIKTRDDVLSMGIGTYNEECRSIVMRYSKEWEKTVKRLGRWIDFENDYKTMDPAFMETVWWVFKTLHDRNLVYKGFKVMPYSTACSTPLSNFEAGLNYKDVSDPAVMVSFPVDGDADNAKLVAWTTTPWTLPSNLALCVHPELVYVKLRNPADGAVYIVAEARMEALPGAVPKKSKSKKGKEGADKAGFEKIASMRGAELANLTYQPLLEYFAHLKAEGAFRVCCDTYVTDDSGTGVVHQAPAFGEDDYRVCMAHGVIKRGQSVPCPVDESGRFTDEVTHFAKMHVKDADKEIVAKLKAEGRLVDVSTMVHSYPYCWRSDTPLIYKAVPSWFVAVETIKEDLLRNNSETYWVPTAVKEKRFHNWLEDAHDWAVSRSRFWGTPIPIWASEDGEELVVVGSIAELERLSGRTVTDLHRHFIDDITIPSATGRGLLRRVDDVFDCWFESGSMPYAQVHYPFERREAFEATFPADFVAEGLDQTRGWFYTLMVLSTALFNKPAFKNLVCNGLVLAADGKKMSKRLRNYPDPTLVVEKYGADALRLYLINSPVVRAETLKFREEGVYGVVKDVFLPWYNAYRFLVQNILRLEAETGSRFAPDQVDLEAASNVLDVWISASTRRLTGYVRREMGAYRLYTVVPYLVKFIDSLTNVYVRYNRKRLKGKNGPADTAMALAVLFDVLLTVVRVMAPFTPFFTETIYQNLRKCMDAAPASVHFLDIPMERGERAGDERVQESVRRMQDVIELGRTVRERRNRPLKQPLKKLVVAHTDTDFLSDLQGELLEYVVEEINVRTLVTSSDPLQYNTIRAEPDWGVLGKKLGKAMGAVGKAMRGLDAAAVQQLQQSGQIELEGHTILKEEVKIVMQTRLPEGASEEQMDVASNGEVTVVLDLEADTELLEAGMAREFVNRFQKLRKKAGLTVVDTVELWYEPVPGADAASSAWQQLDSIVASRADYLQECLGAVPQGPGCRPAHAVVVDAEETFVGSYQLRLNFRAILTRPCIHTHATALLQACGGSEALAEGVRLYLASRPMDKLLEEARAGPLPVCVDGTSVTLVLGKEILEPRTPSARAS